MKILRTFALFALIWCFAVAADSPRRPAPLVFTSSFTTSDVMFAMMPAIYENDKLRHDAYGIAYRLDEKGVPRELYRTSGWYSFEVSVSRDARYIVNLNSSPFGQSPSIDHEAIAFYDKGKLLRSYSTAELVKDHRKVEPTTSHYRWLERNSRNRSSNSPRHEIAFDSTFTIVTIDEWLYEFDITTGLVKSVVKVPDSYKQRKTN